MSISKWNFDRLADREGNLKVIVYNGEKIAGQGIVNKKKWIKTAKLKEEKIVFRPDEPMIFWHNNLTLKSPETEEEKLKRVVMEYGL